MGELLSGIRHVLPKCFSLADAQKVSYCPDWCGSAGFVSSCKQKGGQFDSRSGYMFGLQSRSPVGDVVRVS